MERKLKFEIEVAEISSGVAVLDDGKEIEYKNLVENFLGGLAKPKFRIASDVLLNRMKEELTYGDKVRVTCPLEIKKDKWVLGAIISFEKLDDAYEIN